jgi:hypothetical protein
MSELTSAALFLEETDVTKSRSGRL